MSAICETYAKAIGANAAVGTRRVFTAMPLAYSSERSVIHDKARAWRVRQSTYIVETHIAVTVETGRHTLVIDARISRRALLIANALYRRELLDAFRAARRQQHKHQDTHYRPPLIEIPLVSVVTNGSM